jgi:hypothetical protein
MLQDKMWQVLRQIKKLRFISFHNCLRFEVFTAMTMKNAVFWDTKSQFVLHRRHITSALQSPAS